MSNKSGNPSDIIAVPQGGGALKSIGEKFSPDLHTGTGNMTIPISLPPGRNGFQPKMDLVYSTGNGQGSYGLGWGLSIPGISRRTSKGVPLYEESKDIFILSTAEDLVSISEVSPNITSYRPRTENLFALIDHHHGIDDYWEVKSKDGLISRYGTSGSAASEPAIVANPSNRSEIFIWKLAQTRDPFGNRIEYEYERELRDEGPHHWDQLYLKQIKYGDYVQNGETKFLVSVDFEYEYRPDPFSDHSAGFEIRTTKRCVRIAIRTHFDEERLVRSYNLAYLDQGNNTQQHLPPNGTSLLSQIKVIGYDGDLTEELPPLEFGYSQFEPQERDFIPLTGLDMPRNSLAHPDYDMADMTGNGLPGVLEMNGAVRYWRNLGGGRFDLPREVRAVPDGLRLADKGVQLIDANGDGRLDLMVTNDSLAGYFQLCPPGLLNRDTFRSYRSAPSFDLEDPEVRLVDLDGDGVTDAIRSGTRLECFFNDPLEGWVSTRYVERRSLDEFPNVNFSAPQVKWADMTGNGLQDVVVVNNGSVEYWPSLGRGDWGKRIVMSNSPCFPYDWDPVRVLVGDVDGDGVSDLIYVEDAKVTLWINQSGNGWSDPIEIHGTPPVSDMDAVRLADMMGTGISGVLWTSDVGRLARASMFFLDFTGGRKPYLLNNINNCMGAVTRIMYAPSTQFYLDDEKKYETRWKTTLPFPVQVVARVETIDELSQGKLTTEYSYHHGYWDGAEREFRGFGRVDQRDTEVFDSYNPANQPEGGQAFNVMPASSFSPPTETRTWFFQGPVGDEFGEWEEPDFANEFWPGDSQVFTRPETVTDFLKDLPRRARRDALRALKGNKIRTELYAIDGTERQNQPYTVTEHLYGIMPLPVGEALPEKPDQWQLKLFFPCVLAERTTQWERGDDPMTRFTFTGDYDKYGQPCSHINVAVPRGRDYLKSFTPEELSNHSVEAYLATLQRTIYADPKAGQPLIVNRVARTTSYEIINDGETISDPRPSVFHLVESIKSGSAKKRATGQVLNFYDGQPFDGLPGGEVGEYGALVRIEILVLTEDILREAYKSGAEVSDPPEQPPYLLPDGSPPWTAEYPQEFCDQLPSLAGYKFRPGGGDNDDLRGYFAISERRSYDFHNQPADNQKGLIEITRDALGHDTVIGYDDFKFLPAEITDAAGLQTKASYDYRVLQPYELTDFNGNRMHFTFTPLGLLRSVAVMGKEGEQKGDMKDRPSTLLQYDFMAFHNSPVNQRQPIFVRTIKRERHAWDLVDEENQKRSENGEPPLTEAEIQLMFAEVEIENFPGRFIQSREYSDGFGRLLQTRTQAEEVFFGDPLFGGGVLSSDQSVIPGDAIGEQITQGVSPSVVVSGWQMYDNKGQVIKKYEPFFSTGWEYAPPADDELGQSTTMRYDPRGHTISIANPDGSEKRVVYGIPIDLDDPQDFIPTPWETYTYDANDNAGRTHPDQSFSNHHWNTPGSNTSDALGRTIETVERNRSKPAAGDPLPPIEEYRTHFAYDISDNLLTVTDELNRLAFSHVYDLANNMLRIESIDAGMQRSVLDAAGNIIEQRDSKGAVVLHMNDIFGRPIRLWARDNETGDMALRERWEYGDGGDPNQLPADREANRIANRLGKLYKQYDEAGLLTGETYDFKGNVLEKSRQVIRDEAILAVFDPAPQDWQVQPFRVDWQPPVGLTLNDLASELLDAKSYATSLAYDALNRIKLIVYPQDVKDTREELRPHYNRAGALERVDFDGATFVEHIAYNAKGQRALIAYGNGVMTRYAHDAQTFRLARMRSERYIIPPGETFTYHPTAPGLPLQDIAYEYDLTGNMLRMEDRTPGGGVKNNPESFQEADSQLAQLLVTGNALVRRFEYDPLYRLLSATGRECNDIAKPRPWTDDQRCGFNSGNQGTPSQDNAPDLTCLYTEKYSYDPAGNMVLLKHQTNGDAWTRHFGMGGLTPQQWSQEWPDHLNVDGQWTDAPGNRLTHVGDSTTDFPQTHFYDDAGNLTSETTSRHFEWDHSNRMRVYRTQTEGAEPSVYAQYLYDAGGQRVKKLVRKQSGQVEVTIYIDGLFEHHRIIHLNSTEENNTIHIMDDKIRIAMVRVGDAFADDNTPAVKFHLGDHLGSSSVSVDNAGAWINREEYTPYGETVFGSFARKRYRFTGKERDEESGLYYHGARYYVPWLGRWASPDPSGMVDGLCLYMYVCGRVLVTVDPSGRNGVAVVSAEVKSEYSSGAAAPAAVLARALKATHVSKQGKLEEGIAGSHFGRGLLFEQVRDASKATGKKVSEIHSLGHLQSGFDAKDNGVYVAYPNRSGPLQGRHHFVEETAPGFAKLLKPFVTPDVKIIFHGCRIGENPGIPHFVRLLPVGARVYGHQGGSAPGEPYDWVEYKIATDEKGKAIKEKVSLGPGKGTIERLKVEKRALGNEPIIGKLLPKEYVEWWVGGRTASQLQTELHENKGRIPADVETLMQNRLAHLKSSATPQATTSPAR